MFAVKREFYRDNFSRLINCNVSGRIEENHKQENISSKIFKKYVSLWVQMKWGKWPHSFINVLLYN